MDFRFLFHRVKYFIINPGSAWDVVYRENRPIKFVRGSFFMPLIIFVSLCSFFGSLLFINNTLKPVYSLLVAADTFIVLYLGVYGSALVIREITKALDLGHDFVVAFKLVAYSLTPLFLCLAVSRLFESLLFINILSLASLYILWIGMVKMLNPPDHKKMPMVIASVLSMVIIFVILQIAFSKLTETIYFALFA